MVTIMQKMRFVIVCVLTFVLLCDAIGQKRLNIQTQCENSYIINISNGTYDKANRNIIYNNVTYPFDKYFHYDDNIMGCVCDVQLCVSKCCKNGHTKLNGTCTPGFPNNISIDLYHENFELAENNVRHHSLEEWEVCDGILLEEDETYHILKDGRLYYPDDNRYFQLHEYCVAQFGEALTMNVQLCYDDVDTDETSVANTFGMIFSIPFLLITLTVYLILPDKKIQTKCLMAYVTCLMLSYFFLVYLQLNKNMGSNISCEVVGACGVYFFMATFFWMNVTCIDMYWTFSGRRGLIQGSSSKWKQFGMYIAFANGSPIILLVIIFSLNTHSKESWYHPGFGDGQCWIQQGMPQLLYFYGPMAILLIINTCLFIFTAVTIRQKLLEGQKMMRSKESQRHYDSNKQDYKLYIKLFIAMGINWTMEFVSWIVDWSLGTSKIPAIWYVTDFGNAIYGVFIFVIFVCKRTIWIKLKQRYYICMGKPNMARALSTRTSGYQMSQTEKTNVEDSTFADILTRPPTLYVDRFVAGSTTINHVECYDADANEWLEAAPMNLNRSALSACVISGLKNAKDYSLHGRNLNNVDAPIHPASGMGLGMVFGGPDIAES